jgi:hypothetical protein
MGCFSRERHAMIGALSGIRLFRGQGRRAGVHVASRSTADCCRRAVLWVVGCLARGGRGGQPHVRSGQLRPGQLGQDRARGLRHRQYSRQSDRGVRGLVEYGSRVGVRQPRQRVHERSRADSLEQRRQRPGLLCQKHCRGNEHGHRHVRFGGQPVWTSVRS